MNRLSLFAACAVATISFAADPVAIPEIEGPRAAYHQALAKIRAERDQKAAEANRAYATRLQELHKKLTDEGETQAVEAVKAEIDRVAKGAEPSNEERRKMTGLLLATRVLYEKNRGPAYMAAARSEAQAHEAWARGLAQLEDHLTKQRQFAKVAVVKAERAKTDQAKAAAEAASIAPSPAAAAEPKLDPALAAKIKAAIQAKTITNTPTAGRKAGDANVPEDGAVLVGFELSEFSWRGKSVKSLDPIFLTPEGAFRGEMRGKHSKNRTVAQAPDGYAVGALNVYTHDRIAGLQLIFMKLDAATGRLDPKSRFETKWFGSKGDGEPTQLGGDGRLVVGVHGARGADADSIGLVQMP